MLIDGTINSPLRGGMTETAGPEMDPSRPAGHSTNNYLNETSGSCSAQSSPRSSLASSPGPMALQTAGTSASSQEALSSGFFPRETPIFKPVPIISYPVRPFPWVPYPHMRFPMTPSKFFLPPGPFGFPFGAEKIFFHFPPRVHVSKKYFRCPQCRYVTDRKNNLKRHIATMHQDCGKVLECCEVLFQSKAALRDHVMLFHRNGYKCRFCGRNFCRKALLKRHLTVHSGQKDFVCSICDYATSHKSNLERHKKVHGRKSPVAPDDAEVTEDELMPDVLDERSYFSGTTGRDHEEPNHHITYRKSACRKHKFAWPDRLKSTHSAIEEENQLISQVTNEDPRKYEVLTSEESIESKDVKDIGSTHHSPKRLCAMPYKCAECGQFLPSQSALVDHAILCKHTDASQKQTLMKVVPGQQQIHSICYESQEIKSITSDIAVDDSDGDSDSDASIYSPRNTIIKTEVNLNDATENSSIFRPFGDLISSDSQSEGEDLEDYPLTAQQCQSSDWTPLVKGSPEKTINGTDVTKRNFEGEDTFLPPKKRALSMLSD